MTDVNAPVVPPPPHSLGKATALAVVVAAVVLVTTVLPAEYGIDPLGTGRALGLTGIAGGDGTPPVTVVPKTASAGGPVAPQTQGYKIDAIEFLLIPGGTVEYKYHLDKDATMIYSWVADDTVAFDFHTVPDGKGNDASESFEAGNTREGHGTYTAPYPGIHGWYWQNRTTQSVKVKLTTAGFYSVAKMFDETGASSDYKVSDPPPPPTY